MSIRYYYQDLLPRPLPRPVKGKGSTRSVTWGTPLLPGLPELGGPPPTRGVAIRPLSQGLPIRQDALDLGPFLAPPPSARKLLRTS